MRVNIITALAPLVAIPISYIPLKYLRQEEELIHSQTAEEVAIFTNHIDLETEPNNLFQWLEWDKVHDDKDTTDAGAFTTVNMAAVVSFVSSYLLFKFVSSIARTVMILILMCTVIYKSSHFYDWNDQLTDLVPSDYLQLMDGGVTRLQSFWHHHKEHVGDYIEDFILYTVDAASSKHIMASLLGFVVYLKIG